MIVDCALYRDGSRVPGGVGDLSDAVAATGHGRDGFVWIGLASPTAEEFDEVASEFALHPLAVEDAVHAHQRPKLESYGDGLFLVLKPVRYIDRIEAIETTELMIFAGPGYVVTVRHGVGTAVDEIRRSLEADGQLLKAGPSAVVHAVLDRVVDDYQDIVEALQEDVDDVEVQVFDPSRRNDAERIYKLKREVLEFRRAASPLLLPLTRVVEGAVPQVDAGTLPFFRDVLDHLRRVTDAVDSYDALLSSALEANSAQVSLAQNDDMRRISAYAAIALVPTLIAGIYGMNFQNMPELSWTYGYPMAIGLMVGISALLYRAFRRNGWL